MHPTLPERHPLSPPPTGSNQNLDVTSEWLRDARSEGTIPPPERSTDRVMDRSALFPAASPLIQSIVGTPSLSLRASSLVTAAVLLRIVGYDQLRRLAYADQNASAVRKDVREAVRAGWLHSWSYPIPRYGRVGHVHPTARANAAVLNALRASTNDVPWGALVALMLPSTPRPPLELTYTPKWFAHQREVGHLVTRIVCQRAPLWASAWNEPFPPTVNGLTMPQPDYVLVEKRAGEPFVVFGEHDRGHEPVERFIARKVALYAALAGVCEPLLAVRAFRVDVSVIDVLSRRPIERLRKLLTATRAYGASDLFQFTVGGWLHHDALHAKWFRDAAPTSESPRMSAHARTS